VSLRETIELTKKAHEYGYDAAMVVTPYYYVKNMGPEALKKYYRTLADVSKIPIILYNIPQFSGVPSISEEVVASLSKHENILGIKESGSCEQALKYVQATNDKFLVFNGSASTLVQALKNGCAGAIMGTANFAPELCMDIWRLCKENKYDECQQIQERLKTINDIVNVKYGVAGVKVVMNKLKIHMGECRLPLLPLTSDEKEEIHSIIATIKE